MSDIDLDFLTHLEQREARLLSWGHVDGGFDAAELERLADAFLQEHSAPGTGAELVARLRERALLLEVDDGVAVRHRTRMAETVRLFARLRQLFPRTAGENWTRAPALVADYRLLTRPRAYPRRDVAVDAALDELTQAGVAAGARLEAMRALLPDRGGAPMRLARFQVDATREVLRGLDERRSGGTIVGAGTGSGKTLAFYLPALSQLAAGNGRPGTRVLAIYPRIELLRDQFAEAYREARKLDGVGTLGRPIRIGALYGATPHEPAGAWKVWREKKGWGRICPYMLCPECSRGSLVWPSADIRRKRTQLVCDNCDARIDGTQLTPTRGQMSSAPPDVLFTTTEMLNKLLSNNRMRHLVGAGPRGMPIELVLLDEVHTYEGTTGAHVAGVLRRWRHARRRPVHFVGLSATLREAGEFFACLTGLPAERVATLEPLPHELVREGQEYLLAARADPHSGASVLSTTIQAAMLMQRALDPVGGGRSGGAFGQKLFAFTDDLDVTNRLYFDLLDAEGLNSWGRAEKPSLAALRRPAGDALQARRAAGQTWDALTQIGHRLDDATHMRIGRTTSQDADVDRAASAIVATASLEVGFNDATVGAVLQHKSPHGAAAFLQRKGRAGRMRGMRPWTVAVLSDHGRDRATYQAYERLFDPELAPRTLPVANPAVVRMQAVFATLDWVAEVLHDPNAVVWRLLTGPPDDNRWGVRQAAQQQTIANILEHVLVTPAARASLTAHLVGALGCDEQLVEEIYWQPPRPMLTAVLPTAIRRLRSTWRHLALAPELDHVGDGPLPEFVVSRLFGDLALPEITVVTPPQRCDEDERRESLRAVQAMNAYAPGRVSHRLTIEHRGARHWIAPPPPADDGARTLDLHAFAPDFEELGVFGRGTAHPVRVVRPLTMRVSTPADEILSSSYGRLDWQVEITPSAPSDHQLRPPLASPLAGLVEQVAFHTHGGLAHVEVRRWASQAQIETRTHDGAERGVVRLADSGRGDEAVGIGLASDVDALAVDVAIPPGLLSARAVDALHLRGLRVERWRERFAATDAAHDLLGTFATERVADAVLLALVEEALASGRELDAAYAALRDEERLVAALHGALLRRPPEDANGDDQGPRTRALLDAVGSRLVLDAIAAAVPALWETPDAGWDAWAAERLAASVGAAFHAALQQLCPEYDAEDVVIDVEPPADGGGRMRVWLSEQTIGGGGLLQEAARRVGDRPRGFFDLVAAAVDPSLDETVDAELTRTARAAGAGGALPGALAAVRDAGGLDERASAFDALLAALADAGVLVCHPVVAALSVRFLRPGGSARVDGAVAQLLARWDELEAQLGVDVELRTFAELEARDDTFERLTGLAAPREDPVGWRVGQLTGLLWARGASVRTRALPAPNPFSALPASDPLLLRASMHDALARVPVGELAGAVAADGPLARQGEVELAAAPDGARALRRALLRAAASPVEAGALLHHPRVDRVLRDADGFRARLVLDLVGE